jgi:hypothetical protein
MQIAGLGLGLLLAGGALALDATAPASAVRAVKSPDGVQIRYELGELVARRGKP